MRFALFSVALASLLIAGKCNPQDACKVNPTLPICQPSPSPSPSSTPEPVPSSSPSAPPETQPPSPEPTPTPTPEPKPTPTPLPSPPDCTPHPLPNAPVPLVRATKPPGRGWVCDAWNGALLCAGRTAASDQQEWRTPAGDDCLKGSEWVLTSHNHEGAGAVLKRGMVYDEQRGYFDAYCRRSLDGDTLLYGPEGLDNWGYSGNLPPIYCDPSPSPSEPPHPQPSPTPDPTCQHPDVNKLLVLNYGKCQTGKPFMFFLDTECKELLVTATPKSSDVCDGKACDSCDPSRDLKWTVTQGQRTWRIGDEDVVDIGCATIGPGPIEMTFNRRIQGKSPCEFDLSAVYVDSKGKPHNQSAHVQVVR